MLRIRLTRIGKKNRAYFRIVVAEHSRPVKGKFIEILGHYDPIKKTLVIKKDLVLDWIKKGAKPSNTVAKLLTKQGMKHKAIIITKFHKKPKSKGKTTAKTLEESGASKQEINQPAKEQKQDTKADKIEEKKSEVKSEENMKDKPKEVKKETGLDKK